MGEHYFTTFVRTKNVFKHRLKDLPDYGTVRIYVYEIENLNCGRGPVAENKLIQHLVQRGEIWCDKTMKNFKAIHKGPIDPNLLEVAKKKQRVIVPLTTLHRWMRSQLFHVTLPGVARDDIPVYFNAFLDLRKNGLKHFFSVDSFSGRIHSPVVNLKGDLRFKIRFYGKRIVSLDVKQMQPTILAKVLRDAIGDNSFSEAIFKGEDVYLHLKGHANLPERKDAKKYLFQLIFGQPMNDIGKMFNGDTSWVQWINDYKSRVEPKNPHNEKTHTNLAWLLQYSEVKVMTGIWQQLMDRNIPFLTIHDEILCKEGDEDIVSTVMENELRKHFDYFQINVTHTPDNE